MSIFCSEVIRRRRQNLCALFRDENRVLELSAPRLIARDGCPAIFEDDDVTASFGDDRF